MSNEFNILIVENLELEGEWFKKFSQPKEVEIDNIFAIFHGGQINCDVITQFEEQKINLQSGSRISTGILKACKQFEIRLFSESLVQISMVSAFGTGTLSDLHLMGIPIDIKEVKIVHKPEMGYQISFDFREAIGALGAEEKRKEVQIRGANVIWKINQSSNNFQWRGDKLMGIMPVGEYSIRIRLKNGNWSEWRWFKCKRRHHL